MSKLKSLSLKKKQLQSSGQSSITSFFRKETVIHTFESDKPSVTSKRKATSPISPKQSKLNATNDRAPLIEICDSPQVTPEKKIDPDKESAYFSQEDETISKEDHLRRSPRKHLSPKKYTYSPGKIQMSPFKLVLNTKKNIFNTTNKVDDNITLKTPTEQFTMSPIIPKNSPNQMLSESLCKENVIDCILPDKSRMCIDKLNQTNISPGKKNFPDKLNNSPGSEIKVRRSPRKLTSSLQNNVKTIQSGINKDDIKEEEMGFVFDDDWIVEENSDIEDLDLSLFQRCKLINIEGMNGHSRVKLRNDKGNTATCILQGIWNSLPLQVNDTVSIQAMRDKNEWKVTDTGGILVLKPDVLISSTSVVGGVFCQRKAVLQERFRGMDSGNKAMTIGILVHELLQISLQQTLTTVKQVQQACHQLLSSQSCVQLLFDAGMSLAEAQHDMGTFVPQIVRFLDEVIVNPKMETDKLKKSDEWSGYVEKVVDIEENIITPQLGLKGKIDVTLQVRIHKKNSISSLIPVELKTGRASVSAEHRGQLILYMTMMSLQQLGSRVSQGLLLYLKDMVTLKVVKSGYPEQRDLIMLRNQLAQYLAPLEKKNTSMMDDTVSSCKDFSGVEELGNLVLPEPINHHACGKCPYLTLCSVYQWHTNSSPLNESHHLFKLRQEALGHLSETDVEYFLHWTGLLLLEDVEKTTRFPLHHVWSLSPEQRQRQGRCLTELQVADVQASGDRFLHTFIRPPCPPKEATEEHTGLSPGDYVLVSTADRVWIAAGPITQIDADVVAISLERDLTLRNSTDTQYCIDAYESQSQLGFNLTNLGALMDNEAKAERLRRLIISKCPAESTLLPRAVGRVGARFLRPLNLLQQRAVLRAVGDQYTLVHGMPGTGKTQTVAVLIQMLVALGQKVLITAHTHSAVDNVLLRLPSDMRILRLGSSSRVSDRLSRCCEDTLTKHCTTPEQLRELYESMDVVGVTCLGAGHSALRRCQFSVCVVDESTQVLQSTVLRALFAAERFVLVGDPEQLPPLVHSDLARKLGMDESLFSRLRRGEQTVTLTSQYRMNGRVMALANRFTYDGQLTCANESVATAGICVDQQKLPSQTPSLPWLMQCLSPHPSDSVLLLDTGCTVKWSGGKAEREGRGLAANEAEALVVMATVKAFIQAGICTEDIGVITPYRDQVTLLRKCLSKLQSSLSNRRRSPRKVKDADRPHTVEVNTVDQYQGRDKSVIVYSCCKTWDREKGDYSVKDFEILEDKRRLTVAITRAKHKLILVADVTTLQHYSTFSRLFQCLSDMDKEENTCSKISIGQPYEELKEELGMFY